MFSKARLLKTFVLLMTLVYGAASYAELHTWFGGHIRVNSDYRDWVESQQTRVEFESIKLTGSLSWDSGDTFNFDARYYDNLQINILRYAEYIRKLDEVSQLSIGITRVPFGLQNYLSDSFWYSINYYLGLEDDFDLGAVYHHTNERHSWKVGAFITDELADASEFARYSFDVAKVAGSEFKENGQLNFYYQYSPQWFQQQSKLGFSLQVGQIQNRNAGNSRHWAWSAFYRQPYEQWQTTIQYSQYRYDIEAQQVVFSAFDYPFPIAKKAHSVVLNQAYRFSNLPQFIDTALIYTEVGIVDSSEPGTEKSLQWVLGSNIIAGNFVFYLDYIHGENMWFSGGNGVGVYFPDDIGSAARINFSTAYHF
ncbi:hypothetical protein [Planctobacterium marinum]|uniref:Uncharacterized protein n=1 Tax=Planctobacterium marinum TaxID=1631968 RepID=A0AA48KR02_9ALTE|nr:hypothetical protein MACH26_25290 [Planctobacterium marinum]